MRRLWITSRLVMLASEFCIAGVTIAPWINRTYYGGPGVDASTAAFLALSLAATTAAFCMTFVSLGRVLHWLRCARARGTTIVPEQSGKELDNPAQEAATAATSAPSSCEGSQAPGLSNIAEARFESLPHYVASLPSLALQRLAGAAQCHAQIPGSPAASDANDFDAASDARANVGL